MRRAGNSLARLQAMPVAASLLVLMGAGVGALGGFRIAEHSAALSGSQTARNAAAPQAQPEANGAAPAEVANISSVVRQPNSGIVEVRYNHVVPEKIQGSVEDPAIRRLLMLASENSDSEGVRDDSVGLLAAECRAGHGCQATGIRDALMAALLYDRNVGVRRKALEGLEPYVTQDVQVRDAVLEALMNDPDPRIRTAAVSLLQPLEADTSVREVLYSVANSDRNPHIRTVSRQVLSEVPEIQ